jgi:predicted DNA binding CopG/RHH family protein
MKKEYDLKKMKRRPGPVKSDPEAAKVPTSIRLDGSDLGLLKTEAQRLGIPYQTLVGSIIHRYVIGELLDKKTLEIANELKSA